MVEGADESEVEFAVGGGGEGSGVDFDFLDAGAEERAESGDDAGFFAGARGAVY